MVIAHLDGPHPDLSPAPYVAAVSTTPSATAAMHGWDELLSDPPADLAPAARARLPQLAELEAAWPALAHGNRIVHGDLRADNLKRLLLGP
ncbi:hypothetical protein [Streptomyces sp. NPDC020951]|uniref:hypothetical protein n=1 Tax=Streptomyces sp. NPDC020951 TaxID=3365104 RepID=UPI00379148C7